MDASQWPAYQLKYFIPYGFEFPPIGPTQRKALRKEKKVSDRMVDYVWPCLYWLNWANDDASEDAPYEPKQGEATSGALLKQWALERVAVIEAFLCLKDQSLDDYLKAVFRSRGISHDETTALLGYYRSGLESWAKQVRAGVQRDFRSGEQPNMFVTLAVDCAYDAWLLEHGKKPGKREPGPFLRWCGAIGEFLGLDITPAKVRAAVDRRNRVY
jgi:hypothetical protein